MKKGIFMYFIFKLNFDSLYATEIECHSQCHFEFRETFQNFTNLYKAQNTGKNQNKIKMTLTPDILH